MNSLNLIERQKLKAMKIVEKMVISSYILYILELYSKWNFSNNNKEMKIKCVMNCNDRMRCLSGEFNLRNKEKPLEEIGYYK